MRSIVAVRPFPGESEVPYLGYEALVQKDVGWLDVSMDQWRTRHGVQELKTSVQETVYFAKEFKEKVWLNAFS